MNYFKEQFHYFIYFHIFFLSNFSLLAWKTFGPSMLAPSLFGSHVLWVCNCWHAVLVTTSFCKCCPSTWYVTYEYAQNRYILCLEWISLSDIIYINLAVCFRIMCIVNRRSACHIMVSILSPFSIILVFILCVICSLVNVIKLDSSLLGSDSVLTGKQLLILNAAYQLIRYHIAEGIKKF
jgi:hypothetical protein